MQCARRDYLIRKINGEISDAERAVTAARAQMKGSVERIIGNLHWKDFELLVDLIFREAGLQRMSELGKTKRSLDLELFSPIHRERYSVQVKSHAGRQEFEQFRIDTDAMGEFARHYFVVHEPARNLTKELETRSHELWLPEDIADFVIRYGLMDWIAEKAI